MLKLIIIAAVSTDGVIGIDDNIPWKIPEDFKHFRETTINNMLIVGANTFKNLPAKAHENREFIVLNNGKRIDIKGSNYFQFSNIDIILHLLNDEKNNLDKVFVIGGASIYDLLIDYCDEAIITWVDKNFPNSNKKFPIDKLFANFTEYKNDGWKKSVSGLLYKITYYKKQENGKQNKI